MYWCIFLWEWWPCSFTAGASFNVYENFLWISLKMPLLLVIMETMVLMLLKINIEKHYIRLSKCFYITYYLLCNSYRFLKIYWFITYWVVSRLTSLLTCNCFQALLVHSLVDLCLIAYLCICPIEVCRFIYHF